MKLARENSVRYRQKLLEWEKKAVAEGHPELVRRVNIKKPSSRQIGAKAKPKADAGGRKPAAVKAKPGAKATPSKTSSSKAASPRKTRKSGPAVEE